eukprot:3471851-Pleurochrysis_carterae.AAC.5
MQDAARVLVNQGQNRQSVRIKRVRSLTHSAMRNVTGAFTLGCASRARTCTTTLLLKSACGTMYGQVTWAAANGVFFCCRLISHTNSIS